MTTEAVPELPRFGRFRATAELGAGGMGAVYRAYDERLRREVAIKTILVGRGGDELVERFFHEARAVGTLAHPNIIAVYDMDVVDGTPFLVLELASGGSLKDRIKAGPVASSIVRTVGIQIAQALDAAHNRGILHRDVKPHNILETEPGTFKLADFGIARIPDSTLTMSGVFLGSPAYAAPEAIVVGDFSPASDVYSLGATLYELLTGHPPYGAGAGLSSIIAALQKGPPPLAEHANVPPDLAAAITHALARERGARPSAAELARALSTMSASTSVATGQVATGPIATIHVADSMAPVTHHGPPRRNRRKLAIIAAALVGLLLIGIIAAVSSDPSPHARKPGTSASGVSPAALPAATGHGFRTGNDADMILGPAGDDQDGGPGDVVTDDERAQQLRHQKFKGKGKGKGRGRGRH